MRSDRSGSIPALAPSATIASASRSTQPLFIGLSRSCLGLLFAHDLFRKPVFTFRDHALTASEAAGPPSGAARPCALGSLSGFGYHRLLSRRWRPRCRIVPRIPLTGGFRSSRFSIGRGSGHGSRLGSRLANRRAPPRRFGLLGRSRRHSRRNLRRRCTFVRRQIEIGNGMRQLRFGRRRLRQLIGGSEVVWRTVPGLVRPGIAGLAITLPITTAAAAATTAAAIVAARLVTPLLRLGGKAATCFRGSFIRYCLVRFGSIIVSGFGDRDLLDMHVLAATAAAAPAAATTAARSAIRVGKRRNTARGFGVELAGL